MIMLSIDHQNHSKWPKWGHVRYNLVGLWSLKKLLWVVTFGKADVENLL